MVTQRPLEALFMVRIHVGQPNHHLRLFVEFSFAGIAIIRIGQCIGSFIDSTRALQPDHENADVSRGNSGNPGRLTNGRRTKAVVVTDSGHVALAAIAAETISGRLAAMRAGGNSSLGQGEEGVE